MSENSSCGENDIPAIVLKNCKEELSHPIHLLWEESLKSCFISPCFKKQLITPVHKKDSKARAANYRPVSLTSHVMKIFERIIRKKLVKHLEENQLLCKCQHGFRKGRSCLTQLLKHIDEIHLNLLQGEDTDVIYLDFEKAFDKVDHQILLQKLKDYGIRGRLYNWIEEYLRARQQVVVVDGKHSYPADVKSGVPQGTVLGPVLFLIYINDIEKCIKESTVSSFADDTRIKKNINKSTDVEILQNNINNVVNWSKSNNMALHEKKFEYLCHSATKHSLVEELPFSSTYFTYNTPSGIQITPKSMVRDLGINITPDLNWTPHINIISDSAKKMMSWCLSVFKDRSKDTMLTLFKSMIRSRTEYCCPLWNPHKISDIQTLESIQRTFTSKITGYSDFDYWTRLKMLRIYSLQRRRERYLLMHMFKILNDFTPNDLNINFIYSDRRGILAVVPPLVRNASAKHQSNYDASFCVMGPKLWNTLPSQCRSRTTLCSFKSSLTKFLEMIPDQPPVSGYSCRNNNSILQWRSEGGHQHDGWPL